MQARTITPDSRMGTPDNAPFHGPPLPTKLTASLERLLMERRLSDLRDTLDRDPEADRALGADDLPETDADWMALDLPDRDGAR